MAVGTIATFVHGDNGHSNEFQMFAHKAHLTEYRFYINPYFASKYCKIVAANLLLCVPSVCSAV